MASRPASRTMAQAARVAASWSPGWIVFSDPNSNFTVDGGERLLKVQAAFTGTVPDTFSANPGAVTAVTFNREGFATTPAGFVPTTITLQESTNNAAYTRCLLITAVGLISVQNHVVTRRHANENAQHPNPYRTQGFSLIEVMVAVVVICIGLLGIAKMQAMALSNTNMSRQRSLAAIEAASIAASMHSNRQYWAGTIVTPFNVSITGNPAAVLRVTEPCRRKSPRILAISTRASVTIPVP